MRIGVNARLLLTGKLEGIGWHAWEIISRLIKLHPQHQFILFYDRHQDIRIPVGHNVLPVSLGPPSRHPLLIHIWCEYVLPRACLDHRLDLFYSPEPLMPGALKVPVIITIHDLTPYRMPETMTRAHRWYYQYIIQRNINKANHILTVSNFSKQELISLFNLKPDNITVVYNAARAIFKPIEAIARQLIRDRFAQCNPYFISVGAIHERKQILQIIQAFELFKTTYKTLHKLLLVGKYMGRQPRIKAAVDHSHYKRDIIHLGYLEEENLANVMASADALINLSAYEGFGMPLVEAFQSGTPVIAAARSCYPEIAGHAAILVDPEDSQLVSESMWWITKHPDRLRDLGLIQALRFDWDQSAQGIASIFVKIYTENKN